MSLNVLREGPVPHAELQERLADFANSGTDVREAGLSELVDFIFDNLEDPTVVRDLSDPELNPTLAEDHRPRLQRAAQFTASTLFQVADQVRRPWTGGFTVIELSMDGQVLAGHSNPVGEVYEAFGGDTLFRFALAKALILLHINQDEAEDISRPQNLEDPDAFQYVQGLLPNRQVHMGATTDSSRLLIVGGSGCELTEDYKRSLLPPSILTNLGDRSTGNLLAARADLEFSNITLGALYRALEPGQAVVEPEFFAQLRNSH